MDMEHTHSRDCICGNELDELCCAELVTERLAASCRRTVTVTAPLWIDTAHTFTDTDDDAIALVIADNPDYDASMCAVTYVDSDNSLDPYNL